MHGLIVWFIGGGLLAATVVKLFLFDQPRRPARNMTWTWSTSGASPELKLRWTPWSYMCATTTIRGVSASRRATICATGATCCGRLCCSRSARLGRSPGGSRAALRSSRRRGVAKGMAGKSDTSGDVGSTAGGAGGANGLAGGVPDGSGAAGATVDAGIAGADGQGTGKSRRAVAYSSRSTIVLMILSSAWPKASFSCSSRQWNMSPFHLRAIGITLR